MNVITVSELVGYAELPADTFAEGPSSGNFIETDNRETPFDSQPVQGFSGVQFADEDSFWFLSDNGFGSKSNSADYLLRIYQVDPDFAGSENGDGSVEVENFIQLSDPNQVVPFDIVNEGTSDRLLTGADFDIESFVLAEDGTIWIGDEFGPFLLHFNGEGELIEIFDTPNITNLNTLNGQDPLVIAHRGASGTLPEHTLEAYQLAIELGADFIEPDLVTTSDGVLIARHEPLLDDTTNVAEVFGEERKSTKILDGVEITGYFAEDFTLEEIKQLRAVQPRPYRDQSFNGLYEIPTFAEVIDLVQEVEAETGKEIGIYPETKHPTFFDNQGLSLEEKVVEELVNQGFTDPDRIFIQSFEIENLIDLQGLLDAEGIGDIPLVQLYGDTTEGADPSDPFSAPYDVRYNVEQGNDLEAIYGDLVNLAGGLTNTTVYGDLDSPEVLEWMSNNYAEGAGPWKNNILLRESLDTPVDGDGDGNAEITTQLTGEITSFVEDAHDAGLQVHPYTMRDEELFLTLNADGTPQTPQEEYKQLIEVGFDGFFSDFPGTAVSVVESVTRDLVTSPDNPFLEEGQEPNLSGSRGFEGMAFSPDRQTLYPMLEGTVTGDPEASLRIYEFDLTTQTFAEDLAGLYQMDAANHAIGDFTPINDNEFLVIERDGGQGETAEFKKIFKIDISNLDEDGFVEKELVVDLLDIADPNDLNNDGSTEFDFPFVTIEDVLVIDENTILVANDNNYPFSIGRGPDIDNNEIIQVELPITLDLDERLGIDGGESEAVPTTVFGSSDADEFDSVLGTKGFIGEDQNLFTGSGEDTVDVSLAAGSNRIDLGSDDDLLFAGGNNRILAGSGDDILFMGNGEGNNLVTGQDGADQFWLVTDTEDLVGQPNVITDFTPGEDVLGFANTELSFADLDISSVDGNAVINAIDTDLAILNNVDAASLTADSFAFV